MNYDLKNFIKEHNIEKLVEIFREEISFFKSYADVKPYYEEKLAELDEEPCGIDLCRPGENNVSLISLFDFDMDKIDPISKMLFPKTIEFMSNVEGRYRGSFGIMPPTCVVPWHTDHDEDGFIEENAINFIMNVSEVNIDKLPELHTEEGTYKCKDHAAFDPSKPHSATNHLDKEWCFVGMRVNKRVL
jgi:hypothetical protein